MYVLICRAVYFYAYASSKQFLNTVLASDTTLVHIISAACAGGIRICTLWLRIFLYVRNYSVVSHLRASQIW